MSRRPILSLCKQPREPFPSMCCRVGLLQIDIERMPPKLLHMFEKDGFYLLLMG
ncbi:hypothetical protein LINGRAHAP2_LOCUS35919 [Linum grandiflorum]